MLEVPRSGAARVEQPLAMTWPACGRRGQRALPARGNSRGAIGSTKGPDIAYQVVDLGARQRKVRHRSMRVRKESTQLVGAHSAARDCCKAGRTLRNSAGWIRVNHVAIGAPLPSDLCALGNVGKGCSYPNQD